MLYWVIGCMASLVVSLFFTRRGDVILSGMFKLIASSCFVGFAIWMGALESGFGQLMLAGFILSLCGDVLLIKTGDGPVFLAGLSAFLLAHVMFVTAFWNRGFDPVVSVGGFLVMTVFGWAVMGWLIRNHLARKMQLPVLAYVAAIALMVSLAAATHASLYGPAIIWGALLFTVSDLFVARERFVKPGFVNTGVGLALYYVAQLLLASSLA